MRGYLLFTVFLMVGIGLGLPTIFGSSAATSLTQEPEPDSAADLQEQVLRQLGENGVHYDPQSQVIELDGEIAQTFEPLEYLIILERGKVHESLIKVHCDAQSLNAAMLMTGVEQGENGKLQAIDPPPTQEEWEAGAPAYEVIGAQGEGFYIYVYWEIEDTEGRVEPYFFRAEDLVLNVRGDRTYKRGQWVYLGSRFIRPHKSAPEMFAADAEGNLVSLVYFNPANHLLTGADPEADNQYIWYPNMFLLPPLGHSVTVLLSRKPLESAPFRVKRNGASNVRKTSD